jgi:hypothetical protein
MRVGASCRKRRWIKRQCFGGQQAEVADAHDAARDGVQEEAEEAAIAMPGELNSRKQWRVNSLVGLRCTGASSGG